MESDLFFPITALSTDKIIIFSLSLPPMIMIWHLNIKQIPGIMGIEYSIHITTKINDPKKRNLSPQSVVLNVYIHMHIHI